MELGKKLEELRTAKGLSRKDVAANIGVTASAYGMYERGARTPNDEMLKKLADTLECKVSELMGVTDVAEEKKEASVKESNEAQIDDSMNAPKPSEQDGATGEANDPKPKAGKKEKAAKSGKKKESSKVKEKGSGKDKKDKPMKKEKAEKEPKESYEVSHIFEIDGMQVSIDDIRSRILYVFKAEERRFESIKKTVL